MDSPIDRVTLRAPRSSHLLSLLLATTLGLGGCASGGGVMGKAMEAVGLKAPTPKEQSVPMQLLAGNNLNAGGDKKALALVVKVYQLRGIQRFEQVPFDSFLDESREKAALGDDLIKATEILLLPGQQHEVLEKVAPDGSQLGVVALFRQPADSRWRFTFDTKKAAKAGVTIGLHACAMTTTSPALTTQLSGDPHSLSSVNCARAR